MGPFSHGSPVVSRTYPAFVAAGVLLLAGCATAGGWSHRGYASSDAPLRAHVYSTFQFSEHRPFVDFAVNKPAHVAIFHVMPGRTPTVVYPYHPDRSPRLDAGNHGVIGYAGGAGHFRPRVASLFGAPPPSAGLRLDYPGSRCFVSRSAAATPAATGYLLLVASTQPLRLDRVRHRAGFRFGISPVSFYRIRFGRSFRVMDRLVEDVLPRNAMANEWAVDWSSHLIPPPTLRSVHCLPPSLASMPDDTSRSEESDDADAPEVPHPIPLPVPPLGEVAEPVRADPPHVTGEEFAFDLPRPGEGTPEWTEDDGPPVDLPRTDVGRDTWTRLFGVSSGDEARSPSTDDDVRPWWRRAPPPDYVTSFQRYRGRHAPERRGASSGGRRGYRPSGHGRFATPRQLPVRSQPGAGSSPEVRRPDPPSSLDRKIQRVQKSLDRSKDSGSEEGGGGSGGSDR